MNANWKIIATIFLSLTLLMIGCAKKTDTKTDTTTSVDITTRKIEPLADSNVDSKAVQSNLSGYIFSSNSQIAFIHWTEVEQKLNGQLQVYSVDNSSLRDGGESHPFNGLHNGADISITFTGSLWTDGLSGKTLTGTLKGNELVLVTPSKNGKLDTATFIKGTVDEYNQKVSLLQDEVLKSREDKKIANERTKAAQDELKKMNIAKENLATEINNLKDDINALERNSIFSDVISSYNDAWKDMQKIYKDMVDSSNDKPLTEFKLGTVKFKLGSVEYALNSLKYNDGSLDYKKTSVNNCIKDVNDDVVRLQKAYDTLANIDKFTSNKYADSVKNLISNAKNQISVSQQAIKDAQAIAQDYNSKGMQLFEEGKTMVSGLKVTSTE